MHLWSPLGNLPCVTHDNIQHASRIETEPIQMHLRNRSSVMHKRWLFKHTRMHVHTSMPTRHCRPSHNAPKFMNAPDLQRSTLCAAGNDSTSPVSLGLHWSMANGITEGHCFSFCSHKELAHATQNYRLITPSTLS